ncbi:hypothetical protein Scep_007100 [Stephania cephalantha]|uniref:Helicase CHR10 n=1 Tax=Stephania cephalantha TaxID=152367 RepID=A0AAP0PKR3_9MAGN
MNYEEKLRAAAQYVLSTDNKQPEPQLSLNSAEFGVTATLKPHQIEGLSWLIRRHAVGVNVVLGDEMGLGKTLQAASLLSYLKVHEVSRGPFLILCPLSVTDGWMSEMAKFCPELRVLGYVGDKEQRCSLRRMVFDSLKQQLSYSNARYPLPFDVLLTTYDIVLMDQDFLSQIRWTYAVIDEAQRLKNSSSVLYNVLKKRFVMPRRLLMTGTPIQNNLSELWALMHFCAPLVFGTLEQFLFTFREAAGSSGEYAVRAKEQLKILKYILRAFMLRRTKSMLVQSGILSLPPLTEITLIAPLVPLQKKVYLSILRRELPMLLAFSSKAPNHQSLQNIVMQLRKTCSHPYLFPGIEPEPYVEGEHLVQVSGKLIILDMLLHKLHAAGHRVLLFSQTTHTLDILQDFLELRKYTYERLDGSIRAEERFAAIRSFSSKPAKGVLDGSFYPNGAFVFLISTRAGGVGLNLVAADTVIFYEQDWNPQVDKQALQRAHRIGQMNHVLSINIVTGRTVEEMILRRAVQKLRLSKDVVGDDGIDMMGAHSSDLQSIILGLHMFDPSEMGNEDSNEINRSDMNAMVEKVINTRHEPLAKDDRKSGVNSLDLMTRGEFFFGESSALANFDDGLDESSYLAWVEKLKRVPQSNVDSTQELGLGRNFLEEKHSRVESARKKAEERKLSKWQTLGYKSLAVQDPGCNVSDYSKLDHGSVEFVYGDCTQPSKICPSAPALIFCCIDNSGNWGHGGMFDALEKLSTTIPDSYRRAFVVGDLHLGDLHLIQTSEDHDRMNDNAYVPQWVALAIVQSYNPRRKVPRSNISLTDLEECLKKASFAASQNSGSLHSSLRGQIKYLFILRTTANS